ncbi:MAG: nucleoside hydrolase, partial [Rhodospirillales bacterium]|nr:nucleoside hydrolase [Rhodospirillales bacterium]
MSARAPPRPTIIDCDPGTDDALALLLALASPELAIRAVTVVGGNVGLDRTLPNARAIIG